MSQMERNIEEICRGPFILVHSLLFDSLLNIECLIPLRYNDYLTVAHFHEYSAYGQLFFSRLIFESFWRCFLFNKISVLRKA